MSSALLVVDMLVGFLEPGHNLYCGEAARNIVPRVRRLIEEEQAKNSGLFFICDTHEPDDLEFQIFPAHCVKGTREAEVIPELSGYKGYVIRKQRYSAFFNTELDKLLAELRPDEVIICGVCTDICVMHTAADARNRDYAVEVPVDCVATFDPDAHNHALRHMEKILGVNLARTPATRPS